jgi:hypothetical protein
MVMLITDATFIVHSMFRWRLERSAWPNQARVTMSVVFEPHALLGLGH